MSKTFSIDVQERVQLGSANSRRMRRDGQVPVVVYGHGQAATSLSISTKLLGELLHHSGLVEMSCDNGGKRLTILKAAQRHPISNEVLHLDFLEVKMDEVITSEVRVVAEGEAVGIHHGGQLEQVMFELQIKCLPTEMPETIKVDVSAMELDSSLHVRDLVLPEGVTAVGDGSLVVFQVRAPKAEVSAEATESEEGESESEEKDDEDKDSKEKK